MHARVSMWISGNYYLMNSPFSIWPAHDSMINDARNAVTGLLHQITAGHQRLIDLVSMLPPLILIYFRNFLLIENISVSAYDRNIRWQQADAFAESFAFAFSSLEKNWAIVSSSAWFCRDTNRIGQIKIGCIVSLGNWGVYIFWYLSWELLSFIC